MCSDIEIEKVICAQNARADKEEQKMKDEKARLMWPDGISRPIPRSELNLPVKIARKIHAAHRQKKKLDGLCEVYPPEIRLGKVAQKLDY